MRFLSRDKTQTGAKNVLEEEEEEQEEEEKEEKECDGALKRAFTTTKCTQEWKKMRKKSDVFHPL